MTSTSPVNKDKLVASVFRVLLFAAAASLAAYIPFKYATQLHTVEGSYAVLFPFSSLLAIAGMILAVRPQLACGCSSATRGSLAVLGVAWMVTGMICVPALTVSIMNNPAAGLFATFQMIAQHIFLSLSIFVFALVPDRMARRLGASPSETIGRADLEPLSVRR